MIADNPQNKMNAKNCRDDSGDAFPVAHIKPVQVKAEAEHDDVHEDVKQDSAYNQLDFSRLAVPQKRNVAYSR